MQLRNGIALVGRLLRSAADLGVELRTSSPAVRLLQDGGAVCGAVLGTPEGEVEVRARRGVVLAAGGFPHDLERRRAMFPADQEHWTVAAPSRHRRRRCASASPSGGRVDDDARRPGRLVPGVAGALSRRHGRPLPAHHRARQAGHHRRARGRAALLQRGQRLPRLRRGHAARRAPRAGGRVLAGLHARLPAPLRPGHRAAGAAAGRAVHPVRATSRPAGRSPSWPGTAGSIPRGWSGRSRSTTGTPARARTPPSAAARRPTIATGGDPATGPTPASRRSSAGRSTR